VAGLFTLKNNSLGKNKMIRVIRSRQIEEILLAGRGKNFSRLFFKILASAGEVEKKPFLLRRSPDAAQQAESDRR
jgi:hypothetical protein